MKNIEVEIQVKIKDPEKIEQRLKEVGELVKSKKQVDKYFDPPQKNYFAKDLPDEYLRVRYEEGSNHINYSSCDFDNEGSLRATYEYESIVEKPEVIEEIFNKIGLIFRVMVKKTRKYFNCGDFEVTLDNIEGLGDFMEIEAKKDFGGIDKTREACNNFLKSLNVEYEAQEVRGYPRMLYKKLNNS